MKWRGGGGAHLKIMLRKKIHNESKNGNFETLNKNQKLWGRGGGGCGGGGA